MAYLPREERRAAIVDATLGVLQDAGFAAVSARSVAQRLGGSPGLIHQHFPSVPELVATAWRQYVAKNLAEFSAALGAEGIDPRAEFFANHLDPAQGSELGIWADAWGHALRNPEFGTVFHETIAELSDELRRAMPGATASAAEREVLLAVALAGMQRIAPDSYGPDRVAEVLSL